MSKVGQYSLGSGGLPPIETLTGNTGGPVGPDAAFNINVVGDTTTVTVAGNPATNTLTISTAGTVATQYDTDAGSAVPAAGILNVLGGHDINTSGAGNTVTINLDNAITLGDLSPVVGDALHVVTGDISLDDGNVNLTNTNGTGTSGVIQFGGIRTISNFGTDNIFIGQLAGNLTVTGTDNSAFGDAALSGVGFDGSNVIAIGSSAAVNYTSTESDNIIIGNSGVALENNTIRIGTTGGGAGQQNNTYIAGINGVDVGSVASVVSISGDHLGLTTITAGTGISVTPGANTITIAITGSTNPVTTLHTQDGNDVTATAGVINLSGGNNITTTGTAGPNTATISLSGITQHSLQVGGASNALTQLGVATNGQLPIGSTGADPVLATITAGTGITVTNGAGSITISADNAGFVWTVVTTTQTAADNNGFFTNAGGAVTINLPATSSVGDVFQVAAMSAGGWTIAQAAGQQVRLGNTTTTLGAGGSLSSTAQGDWITVVCNVANTGFMAYANQGNITVV